MLRGTASFFLVGRGGGEAKTTLGRGLDAGVRYENEDEAGSGGCAGRQDNAVEQRGRGPINGAGAGTK